MFNVRVYQCSVFSSQDLLYLRQIGRSKGNCMMLNHVLRCASKFPTKDLLMGPEVKYRITNATK